MIFIFEFLDFSCVGIIIADWIIRDIRSLGRVIESADILINKTIRRRKTSHLNVRDSYHDGITIAS